MISPELKVVSWGTVHNEPMPGPSHHVHYVDEWFKDPYGISDELRQMTGRDAPVIHSVMRQEGALDYVEGLYRGVLPLLFLRQRTVVMVIACVGGRHRSVVFADEVGQIATEEGWTVAVEHPHIDKPVTRRGGERHG